MKHLDIVVPTQVLDPSKISIRFAAKPVPSSGGIGLPGSS